MPYEPEEEPFDLTCGYYKHIHKFTSAPANQVFSCPICGATLLVTAQIGIIPFVIDRDLCNCDQIDLQSFTALHQLADEHRNMLVEHLGSVNDDEQVEISVELNCPLFIITAWDKTALLTSEEMAKIIHLEQDKKDWLLRENGLLRDSGLNLHTSPGLQENETLITRQVFRQFLLHQIERGGFPANHRRL